MKKILALFLLSFPVVVFGFYVAHEGRLLAFLVALAITIGLISYMVLALWLIDR